MKFNIQLLWCLCQAVAIFPSLTTRRKDPYLYANRKMLNVTMPIFERPIGNHSVTLGREAKLGCYINNIGPHLVGWLKAEDQTMLAFHDKAIAQDRYAVNRDFANRWQLHIKPIELGDEGCYMCQVNSIPMMWQTGCLNINVPPQILNEGTSTDVSVAEHDNATFTCAASGRPSPRVYFIRENEKILLRKPHSKEFEEVEKFMGTKMVLWRANRIQMGVYFCVAVNEIPPGVNKRISLYVNFPPTVYVPNQLLGAPFQTNVTMKCLVEAFPQTINYWVKNGGEMLLNGSKYKIWDDKVSYKTTMWMVIKNFSMNDVGTYNCVSTNSLGQTDGTLRLYDMLPEYYAKEIPTDEGCNITPTELGVLFVAYLIYVAMTW